MSDKSFFPTSKDFADLQEQLRTVQEALRNSREQSLTNSQLATSLDADLAALKALVLRKDEALLIAAPIFDPLLGPRHEKAEVILEALALEPSDLSGCVVLTRDEHQGTQAAIAQDEHTIKDLRATNAALTAALEKITRTCPAHHQDGGLYVAHFNKDGTETGIEFVDPLTVINEMEGIARTALARAGGAK